jgi:hypothetical protein
VDSHSKPAPRPNRKVIRVNSRKGNPMKKHVFYNSLSSVAAALTRMPGCSGDTKGRHLRWICVLLLLPVSLIAAGPNTENLIFYLSCDDAVNPIDESVDPAATVLHGSLTSVPGQFGTQGLGFNGNKANRIEVLNAPKLDGMSALTIEAWAQPRNLALHAGLTVVSKASGPQVGHSYTLWAQADRNVYGRINGNESTDLRSTTTLEDGVWYHLALVFDSQSPANERMKLYINGVLNTTHYHPGARVNQIASSLWVGDVGKLTEGFNWDGALDEIGIWNTALTAEEIGQLMQQSKASLLGTGSESEPPFEVVASGLDNPRGLVFANDGTLYIVEAGRGGEGPSAPGPEGAEVYFGPSGAITEVREGVQKRIVTGLPSMAHAGGSHAGGPYNLVLGPDNVAFVANGLGGSPATRDAFGPEAVDMGKLLRVNLKQGTWESLADLVAYEAGNDPDGGGVDSNPYDILSVPGRFIVTDAGGNDLLSVTYDGQISTLARFPAQMVAAPPSLGLPAGAQIPAQAVPTAVVLGPDLALYVGELTGFPFKPGNARVYRVVPGSEPEVFAGGFTNILDLEFRPQDGLLYVLEHRMNGLLSGDTTGALIRINVDGSREVIASDGLVSPGGLAFGGDGAAYVTNFSDSADIGQAVRIPIEP